MRHVFKGAAMLVAGVAAAAVAAPAARAQTSREQVVYIVCYLFTSDGDGTAIATTPYRTTFGDWYSGRWESRLYETILPGTGYRSGRCNPVDSAELAEEYYRKSGYRFVKRVDWPKASAPVAKPPTEVAKSAPSASSNPAAAPYLTVKTDTSAKDAAKAWDEQVKKSLAEQAQKNVRTAIKAAQDNAKQKAQLEAFMAEKRRRGSAQ